MPLRGLLRALLHNEQIISKLADSYPIRRAAQLTAYLFHRGKEIGADKWEEIQNSETMQQAKTSQTKLGSFAKTFQKELEQGFSDMEKQIEQKKKPPS